MFRGTGNDGLDVGLTCVTLQGALASLSRDMFAFEIVSGLDKTPDALVGAGEVMLGSAFATEWSGGFGARAGDQLQDLRRGHGGFGQVWF